jgi:hypothetical protein
MKLAAGKCSGADRDHRARNQPARQMRPQEQQTAGNSDRDRFRHAQHFAAAGNV